MNIEKKYEAFAQCMKKKSNLIAFSDLWARAVMYTVSSKDQQDAKMNSGVRCPPTSSVDHLCCLLPKVFRCHFPSSGNLNHLLSSPRV